MYRTSRLFIQCIPLVLLLSACGSGSSETDSGADNFLDSISDFQSTSLSQSQIEELLAQQNDQDSGTQTTQTQTSGTQTTQTQTEVLTSSYQDSRVSLLYPQRLVLDLEPGFADAALIDADINEQGGNDICSVATLAAPNSSLLEEIDILTANIFRSTPEPLIEFVEVNGEPAARVMGLAIGDEEDFLLARMQTIYKNDSSFLVACFGLSASDVGIIFESFVIN